MTPLDLSIPIQLTLALVPDLILMGGAMLILLWAAWRPESSRHQRSVGVASIVLCVVTLIAVVMYIDRYRAATGPIAVDSFRWLADIIILLGTILAIGLTIDDNDRQLTPVAESHVLLLLASSGMMLLTAARDLIIVFLGIELMSISVYALAGINRRSERSAEGALKYFLLGAFSTAFLLYGIALLYGATGTTNISQIGQRISELSLLGNPLLMTGIALLLVGFGFKVASVPFHMWAPDVYDGSPSPVTGYMAATVKAAAFAAFIRVWLEAFPHTFTAWHGAVAGLAVVTMIFGNAIGLAQRNLKRMLAYSSIGHAGYLLVAVAAGTERGAMALLFYLLAYTLATFAAFGIIVALQREGAYTVMMSELEGLWTVRPWMALGLGITMLALLGFPVFGGAGFLAKWYVIQAALQAPHAQTSLAVVLVLTSVVSAGYYLYVVMIMFMKPRAEGALALPATGGVTRTVIVATVLALLILGVAPDYVVRATYRWGQPEVYSGAPPLFGTVPANPIPPGYSTAGAVTATPGVPVR